MEPDIKTFGTTVAVCEGPCWNFALQVVARATGQILELNSVVGNAAITACGSAKSWETALAFMQRTCKCCLKSDAVTCNAAISACAGTLNGRASAVAFAWAFAMPLLHAMLHGALEPDVVTYSAAL